MGIYKTAEQSLYDFIYKQRVKYREKVITKKEFYYSVCAFVDCLVANNLCGEGWGENQKHDVSIEIWR